MAARTPIPAAFSRKLQADQINPLRGVQARAYGFTIASQAACTFRMGVAAVDFIADAHYRAGLQGWSQRSLTRYGRMAGELAVPGDWYGQAVGTLAESTQFLIDALNTNDRNDFDNDLYVEIYRIAPGGYGGNVAGPDPTLVPAGVGNAPTINVAGMWLILEAYANVRTRRIMNILTSIITVIGTCPVGQAVSPAKVALCAKQVEKSTGGESAASRDDVLYFVQKCLIKGGVTPPGWLDFIENVVRPIMHDYGASEGMMINTRGSNAEMSGWKIIHEAMRSFPTFTWAGMNVIAPGERARVDACFATLAAIEAANAGAGKYAGVGSGLTAHPVTRVPSFLYAAKELLKATGHQTLTGYQSSGTVMGKVVIDTKVAAFITQLQTNQGNAFTTAGVGAAVPALPGIM